jgi:predicted nuclease of restriction endonuclease-like (RecB) superfamily
VPKDKKIKTVAEKVPASDMLLNKEYAKTLSDLKHQIQVAQLKAAVSVNRELICLYWNIGSSILEKQAKYEWGTKIVERLAHDLKDTFPAMKGFSLINIKYMAQFAKEYPDFLISQQAVGQIPWGHNIILLFAPVSRRVSMSF